MKKKIVIIGYGLVGKAAYEFLRRIMIPDRVEITVLSKDYSFFTPEKKWYFFAEKELLRRRGCPGVLRDMLGREFTIWNTFLGQHSSVPKFEDIYKKKTRVFSSGTVKSISYRKYFMDEQGYKREGVATPIDIYTFGNWARLRYPDAAAYFTVEKVSISLDKRIVQARCKDRSILEIKNPDLIISTVPLDYLEEMVEEEGYCLSNYEIETSIGKSLENYPVFVYRTSFNTKDFLSGRRECLSDALVKMQDGDYIRVYDFEPDSPFYQHAIDKSGDNISIYSLSTNLDMDILAYRVYNPGRIRRLDSRAVDGYLDALESCNILALGRYGRWLGAWTIWDDLNLLLERSIDTNPNFHDLNFLKFPLRKGVNFDVCSIEG